MDLSVEELGGASEGFIECSGLFAGCQEMDHVSIEASGQLGHRFGKVVPLLNSCGNLGESLARVGSFGVLDEGAQGGEKRHSGLEHGAKLNQHPEGLLGMKLDAWIGRKARGFRGGPESG